MIRMTKGYRLAAAGALLLALLLTATGCGSGGAADAAGDKLQVTVTIGMIADIVENVGGDAVEVTALMGPGVDPHLYKASEGDIGRLQRADVVFYNGLNLEGRMGDILVKMARERPTVAVSERIDQDLVMEVDDGMADPHIWFDVSLWMKAAEVVRDTLIELAPDKAGTFRDNAAAYLAELEELHEYAKEQFATIPRERRVLVTAHDAFGYLGRAYDIEVVGVQGISTAAEYGLADIQRLVDLLTGRGVKAVFLETSVAPGSIEAVVEGARARGHEVVIGGELFSDAMGDPGTPEGTYMGMVRHNVDTIVEALR